MAESLDGMDVVGSRGRSCGDGLWWPNLTWEAPAKFMSDLTFFSREMPEKRFSLQRKRRGGKVLGWGGCFFAAF